MTVQDMVKKLRVMLAADHAVVTKAKFADATLVDGTVVYTEGELEVGATLLIRVEEGEESPYAPEGIHETTDGKLIGVGPNGEIMEISEVAEEAVATEEVVEEQLEEVTIEAPVAEAAIPATEELLAGIAEIIAPFTEEIASLTEEVTALKARFNKIADEPAATPIRNTFSENKAIKDEMLAKRMDALRAIRKN
jgi:hypothetical protein|tara:strand:+ start:112 stop:693 length:582 start_codon:yes stop_codon:yes gene_type:complete